MSKHTPGPWIFNPAEEIVYGTSYEGEHIVVVYETNTNELDGRLIAAAPDMLALLQEAQNRPLVTEGSDWWIRARAAIAKATGEQP